VTWTSNYCIISFFRIIMWHSSADIGVWFRLGTKSSKRFDIMSKQIYFVYNHYFIYFICLVAHVDLTVFFVRVRQSNFPKMKALLSSKLREHVAQWHHDVTFHKTRIFSYTLWQPHISHFWQTSDLGVWLCHEPNDKRFAIYSYLSKGLACMWRHSSPRSWILIRCVVDRAS